MGSEPDISHQIAVEAASLLVKKGQAAGLSWADITISCETVLAIVVTVTGRMANTPDDLRWAQEMIEDITERAHSRASALIRGVPYEG